MNWIDEALFFEDPRISRKPPGDFGILYLLRRDIDSCMANSILWPGAMAIMAGIDLLAKFGAGEDSQNGVSRRFRAFVEQYFGVAASDAEIVFQLRNSLLHSFGLYSETKSGVRRFQLAARNGALIANGSPGKTCVDLLALLAHFESAVQNYRNRLQTSVGLQTGFTRMFPKYGAIPIGP